MTTPKQIYFASVLVCVLLMTAAAQDRTTQKSTLTITAAAAGERVRITAPSSVVQMHVEVYASGGEKLFDQEIRGGNVFDWHLQDGQAQRLAPGNYVCVVTAKSISGKLTQKIGAVTVAEKSASVLPAESAQLSPLQAQTIGPVEENSSWTVAATDAPQTPTVIANDGTDGQMIRGRGALTFRLGNFFSGVDQEQMRLTEEGNLGIGTSSPQSKLDVAGAIRAERFLVVKPNKSGSDKTAADTLAADGTDSVQPLVSGTGTAGRLTKWTDGSGTLADSVVTEASNNIGISNTNPVNKLDITDTNVTPGSAAINISGTAAIASTKYGVYSDLSGASTTNIAGFFDARGATNNYGLIVNRGNVGIGTTGPIAKLQVSGGPIRLDSNQQLEFGGGVDSISGSNSTHSLVLWTNNNARLFINSAGNVGVGTTLPGSKLDVAGNINTSTEYDIGGNRILSNLGANNLFAGVGAGSVNTGNANTFVGREAGSNNLDGFNNSFFGRAAGVSNTSGSNNSVIGTFAGLLNTEGSDNSFVGVGAGIFNTTGNNNSFFGRNAGQGNDTGSGNTIIGFGADVGAPNLTNATAIGAGAIVNTSSTTVLKGSKIVLDANTVEVPFNLRAQTLFVSSGIGTAGGSVCYHDNPDGYSIIAKCVSSRRYKTNIARLGFGLDLVRRLRPITFDWKEDGKRDLGLIAEDVAAIEPLLATYNSKGQVEGVKYDRVGVLLVNAVQEQQAQITQQQERLERQEEQIKRYLRLARQQQAMLAAQQQQLAGLKKIVCRSHRRCA